MNVGRLDVGAFRWEDFNQLLLEPECVPVNVKEHNAAEDEIMLRQGTVLQREPAIRESVDVKRAWVVWAHWAQGNCVAAIGALVLLLELCEGMQIVAQRQLEQLVVYVLPQNEVEPPAAPPDPRNGLGDVCRCHVGGHIAWIVHDLRLDISHGWEISARPYS